MARLEDLVSSKEDEEEDRDDAMEASDDETYAEEVEADLTEALGLLTDGLDLMEELLKLDQTRKFLTKRQRKAFDNLCADYLTFTSQWEPEQEEEEDEGDKVQDQAEFFRKLEDDVLEEARIKGALRNL